MLHVSSLLMGGYADKLRYMYPRLGIQAHVTIHMLLFYSDDRFFASQKAQKYSSGLPSSNLSVSLRSTAPLVGEPLAKPFTLRGLPKPPLLGEVASRSDDGEVVLRSSFCPGTQKAPRISAGGLESLMLFYQTG